ncbi:GntR family transcriptional regulator [Solibacillus sp.]|uniref:GntR family transcriptional regulator n=1 Tax=Solibacillus sp. TaxID=1909654 RepID=UPI003315AB42
MTIDFAKDRPIYLQLVESICGDIIKGKLQSGDKLPSVREFALDSGVNVNTVQRVYKELEVMALTETKRGQGTFITTDMQAIDMMREQMKTQVAQQFVASIQSLGFTVEEIIDVLKRQEG